MFIHNLLSNSPLLIRLSKFCLESWIIVFIAISLHHSNNVSALKHLLSRLTRTAFFYTGCTESLITIFLLFLLCSFYLCRINLLIQIKQLAASVIVILGVCFLKHLQSDRGRSYPILELSICNGFFPIRVPSFKNLTLLFSILEKDLLFKFLDSRVACYGFIEGRIWIIE